MPKVSVIIPIYNVEKYLEKCLNSVVNQTLKDIQIILINDGSTDNSKNIIEKYLSDERITYLEKQNGGLSDARNYGIPYAKGEYISFIDSDDYVELDMLEEMYKKAKTEKSDIVECDFIWEYPNKIREDKGKHYKDIKDAIVNGRVVAWNKLYKKELLEKTKIVFPKGLRYEDVEFFYKLIPYVKKYSYVEKNFIHYMQRNTSIANTQNERTGEIFSVLENVVNYYKEKNIYEEYKNEIEYSYARILLCSSLKRIVHIENEKIRRELLEKTWNKLNQNFPNWKKNKYLSQIKSTKNLYMRTINGFTFKIYSKILEIF